MAVFRNLVLAAALLVGAAIVWAVGLPETPVGGRVLSVLTSGAAGARAQSSDGFYQYVDQTGALKIVDDIALVPPDQRKTVSRVEAKGKKVQQFRSAGSGARD